MFGTLESNTELDRELECLKHEEPCPTVVNLTVKALQAIIQLNLYNMHTDIQYKEVLKRTLSH